MKAKRIINISSEMDILADNFIYQYLYSCILITVFHNSSEFHLRQYKGKWHASYRKNDTCLPLADLPDFDVEPIVNYIKSISVEVVDMEKLLDCDGVVLFSFDDEIVVALIWHGSDGDGRWVSFRLLFDDTAPPTAQSVLERFSKLVPRQCCADGLGDPWYRSPGLT